MYRLFRSIVALSAAILALLLLSASVFSQVQIQISKAVAFQTTGNPNHWQIAVGFSDSFDLPANVRDVENPKQDPIKDPRNFYLIDIDTGQRLGILYVYFDASPFYF